MTTVIVPADEAAEPPRFRALTDGELMVLVRGWQLPELSFGEQVRSMAMELIGWRQQAEELRGVDPAIANKHTGPDDVEATS